jgi:hypothetical protein
MDFAQILKEQLPEFNHIDAPVAVKHSNVDLNTIPTGMFSTADLVMESKLTNGASGNQNLSINLNHPVVKLETTGTKIRLFSNWVVKRLLVKILISNWVT